MHLTHNLLLVGLEGDLLSLKHFISIRFYPDKLILISDFRYIRIRSTLLTILQFLHILTRVLNILTR